MADVFGPLAPGETQSQLNSKFNGSTMLPLPPINLAGGDAGPSGAVVGDVKSGSVYIGGLNAGPSFLNILVFGVIFIVGLKIWKKSKS